MRSTVVCATGSYLPEIEINNEDLTQFSLEAQALIREKTGVLSRRNSPENVCTSDLAVQATLTCLQKAAFPAEDLEAVVVSTSSPDRMQPVTATRVQHLIGARNAFAFDINSVCSGSSYGIALADSMIKSGNHGNILFVAAEMYSKILNKKDYSTYPYFGDGAGAILFTAGNQSGHGVLRSCLKTDGGRHDTICVPGGGTMLPYEKMSNSKLAFFKMKGIDVFSFTIDKGPEIIRQVCREADIDLNDIDCFICHQANINIIRKIAEEIAVPVERFFVNLHKYGNTASASIPVALDEAIVGGVVAKGDLVLTVAFGGGLSWGANLIRL